MSDEFSTFADLPATLAEAAVQRSRIQIAQLGSYSDPRYGDFAITAEMVASWKRLLASQFQGEVPIDFDHNTDKQGPTGSKAAGWIKSIEMVGTKVMADVEWTPKGAESVRSKEYRYLSPTFTSNHKNEQQKSLGPALLRVALTNSPFLRGMPAVSLEHRLAELDIAARVKTKSAAARPFFELVNSRDHEDRLELDRVIRALSRETRVPYLEALEDLQTWHRSLTTYGGDPEKVTLGEVLQKGAVTLDLDRAAQADEARVFQLSAAAKTAAPAAKADDDGLVRFGPDTDLDVLLNDDVAISRAFREARQLAVAAQGVTTEMPVPAKHVLGVAQADLIRLGVGRDHMVGLDDGDSPSRAQFTKAYKQWVDHGVDPVATLRNVVHEAELAVALDRALEAEQTKILDERNAEIRALEQAAEEAAGRAAQLKTKTRDMSSVIH